MSSPDTRQLIRSLQKTLVMIRKNRPGDAEMVSYALDDMRRQIRELTRTVPGTDTLDRALDTINENRPDDPEAVSYALDTIERVVTQLVDLSHPDLYVVVCDTGSQLQEFENAKGVWADYDQKEWTTYVVDESGETHAIYAGDIVYAGLDAPVLPSIKSLKEKHTDTFTDENKWGVKR